MAMGSNLSHTYSEECVQKANLHQGASLGNFPIFAQAGCPGDDISRCRFAKTSRATPRDNGTVQARPGYFAVSLNTSVKAEMSVSNHSALYRFTFPRASADTPYSPLLLLDLTDLSNSRTNGTVKVSKSSGRITASGTFGPSFGVGSYNLYACVDFGGAGAGAGMIRDTGTFVNDQPSNTTRKLNQPGSAGDGTPVPAGGWVRFSAPEGSDSDDDSSRQILVRVGLSFMSTCQACGNAVNEVGDWDFERLRTDAEDAWRAKLGTVKVDGTGVSTALQTVFWSGLYRSLLSPQDYTGENPLWKSSEPCT